MSPVSTISTAPPPNWSVFIRFCSGVVTGMNTSPRTPIWRQAKATPCAWLPALAQITAPRPGRFRIAFQAPRIL